MERTNELRDDPENVNPHSPIQGIPERPAPVADLLAEADLELFDGVEIDVHAAPDGSVYVVHDEQDLGKLRAVPTKRGIDPDPFIQKSRFPEVLTAYFTGHHRGRLFVELKSSRSDEPGVTGADRGTGLALRLGGLRPAGASWPSAPRSSGGTWGLSSPARSPPSLPCRSPETSWAHKRVCAHYAPSNQNLCAQEENPRNFSGANRDRTGDLLNAIQALSQLSYSPEPPARSGNRPASARTSTASSPWTPAPERAGRPFSAAGAPPPRPPPSGCR
jgi:hypothetical protein